MVVGFSVPIQCFFKNLFILIRWLQTSHLEYAPRYATELKKFTIYFLSKCVTLRYRFYNIIICLAPELCFLFSFAAFRHYIFNLNIKRFLQRLAIKFKGGPIFLTSVSTTSSTASYFWIEASSLPTHNFRVFNYVLDVVQPLSLRYFFANEQVSKLSLLDL